MVIYPPISISNDERAELKFWIESNFTKACFRDANMGGDRLTTRYTDGAHFRFPEVAYQVRLRIASALGFSLRPTPRFKDGMVASYAKPGDTCYPHKDPRWIPTHYTAHCNVIVAAPESGGELVIEGKQYEMPEGEFVCYPVSELTHETLRVKGTKPRLMWVFGFCVPPDQYIETVRKQQ